MTGVTQETVIKIQRSWNMYAGGKGEVYKMDRADLIKQIESYCPYNMNRRRQTVR